LQPIVENKGNNNGVKESGDNEAKIIERKNKTYADAVKRDNEFFADERYHHLNTSH